jgi:hypothetical protein
MLFRSPETTAYAQPTSIATQNISVGQVPSRTLRMMLEAQSKVFNLLPYEIGWITSRSPNCKHLLHFGII